MPSQLQSPSPSSSRASSAPAQPRPMHAHAPVNPSGLRHAHTLSSPEDASMILPPSERTQSPESTPDLHDASNGDEQTRLLDDQNWQRRPRVLRNYGTSESYGGLGGRYPDYNESGTVTPHSLLGDAITDGLFAGSGGSQMSTTQWLAKQHGVKNDRTMYVVASVPNLTIICPKLWSGICNTISP